MKYEVVLLSRAQVEFHAIVDWLAARSLSGTTNWLSAYERIVDRLERAPESFAIAPENEQVLPTIRQALFRTRQGRYYRVLFTIVGRQVRILHLRGPGQELANLDA